MRKDGDYMKIYVQAIMDEDVYDELCSYPEHRVSIIEGSRMETESIIAKEIWSITAKSSEYRNALMDLLGEEIYNKVMILQRED
mgnify:FL=1|jgi:hypothetical protein|nr:MAG TPA: hypothetical protein [Caudoviricetes sp.]